ncbi:MAG: hypothetical protein COB07_12360 [Sulfurovum sp.]|nr:MAG: hypothetical protein COB07_12360 [Sulfurovum sp.]
MAHEISNGKSKYWIFKFNDKDWNDFDKQELGEVFSSAVNNHRQLSNCVGDIVFWYRTDSKKGLKKAIYFLTQIMSEPKENDEFHAGWSIELRVVKMLIDNPLVLEECGFKDLIEKINKMQMGGSTYNLELDEKPEKLMQLVIANENVILDKFEKVVVDKKDLKLLNEIKEKNINEGKMFNPFLDMNLIRHEVRHLSFITNLLNPYGTHHQGTQFLQNFISILGDYESQENNQYLKDFCSCDNIQVFSEKAIFNTGKDLDDEKGRIDIWIENNDYIIAIEGKTETVDSKNQLAKYDKFLQKQGKPYLLIYLTMEGEEPENSYPKNLKLMDFERDVLDFISISLELNMPLKIKETLIEYQNSLITYLNKFNATWTYDLDIINEIIKDKESFEKYEKIKDLYYHDTKQFKFTVVEDVANNFEKAKARVELGVFAEINDAIADTLAKKGFNFNDDLSDILYDDGEIGIYNDIKTIYNARKNRVRYENQGDEKVILLFSKDEKLVVGLSSNGEGLHFVSVKTNKDLQILNEISIELLTSNEFYSSKISNFLDEKYMADKVEFCKTKILEALNL